MLRSSSLARLARRALCAGIAVSSGLVLGQPTGLAPIHGSATITQQGKTTTITTVNGAGTQHSALDWSTFGVPSGATVYFAQPNAQSTSINRVLGGSPSSIDGTLGSNGKLVLVNPAGIAFGAGAAVDTAGFTASTLVMSRDDAIAGRLRFGGTNDGSFTDSDGKTPSLQVAGKILARNGDVVLVGPDIETAPSAVIEANAGDVLIAAGRSVEVTGRGLEGIHLTVRAPDDQAINLGTLTGDSVGIFAGQLQHSGLVQANSVSTDGGKVVLQAIGKGVVDGRIQASTTAHGGSVLVTADKLELKSSASIDVRHASGGGEILVGGGWQGQDARIANASETSVDKGVQLKADATLSGNGGTVVVWSDKHTSFGGAISSRGAGGGQGGQVEVSSAGKLEYQGKVDVGTDPAPASPGSGSTPGASPAPADPATPAPAPAPAPGAAPPPTRGEASAPTVVPMIPLPDQQPRVQADVSQPAAATASYIGAAGSLLAPDSARLAASGVAATEDLVNPDALRVLGGAPSGGRTLRGIVVTNGVCRPGS